MKTMKMIPIRMTEEDAAALKERYWRDADGHRQSYNKWLLEALKAGVTADADLRGRYVRGMNALARICYADKRGFVDDEFFEENDAAIEAGIKLLEEEGFEAALAPLPQEEQHGPGGCH